MKLTPEILDKNQRTRVFIEKFGQVYAALKATPEWAEFEKVEADHVHDLEVRETALSISHPYYERAKAYLSGKIAGLKDWRSQREMYLSAYRSSIVSKGGK